MRLVLYSSDLESRHLLDGGVGVADTEKIARSVLTWKGNRVR